MTEHHQHTETCSTCNRPKGCPECSQTWPRRVPGYVDAHGVWHDGERPAEVAKPKPTPAEKALAAAVAVEDQARARWEAAEMARRKAEHEKMSDGPQLFSNGMPFRPNQAEIDRRIRELAAAAEEARETYRRASVGVLKARQAMATRAYQA